MTLEPSKWSHISSNAVSWSKLILACKTCRCNKVMMSSQRCCSFIGHKKERNSLVVEQLEESQRGRAGKISVTIIRPKGKIKQYESSCCLMNL